MTNEENLYAGVAVGLGKGDQVFILLLTADDLLTLHQLLGGLDLVAEACGAFEYEFSAASPSDREGGQGWLGVATRENRPGGRWRVFVTVDRADTRTVAAPYVK